MAFEYDPIKSQLNRAKHQIDFDEAQALWQDENRVEVQAKSTTEPRYLRVAMLNNKLWSAFFTIRDNKYPNYFRAEDTRQ